MVCDKCGFAYMVDDSHYEIRVYKCWVCGNRSYVDHPKRPGSLVCSRCGDNLDADNELGYCNSCLKYVSINVGSLKERTYGETTCACGMVFIRKSPRQIFHSKDCRKKPSSLHL